MEITIRTGKTRTVSARELSRRTAALLDEIDDEGHAMVIARFGRAAALLVPLERAPKPVRRVRVEEREETLFVIPELDDLERNLLVDVARCHPEPYRTSQWTGDVSALCRTMTRLELNGLVRNEGAARLWLTSEGERAAARLSA